MRINRLSCSVRSAAVVKEIMRDLPGQSRYRLAKTQTSKMACILLLPVLAFFSPVIRAGMAILESHSNVSMMGARTFSSNIQADSYIIVSTIAGIVLGAPLVVVLLCGLRAVVQVYLEKRQLLLGSPK